MLFPSDKTQPFVAENGVTYVYEADRWRVKQYKLDKAALEGYVEQDEFDSSQGVQNDQINLLETQVQLLAQVQVAGKWNYERQVSSNAPRPPKTGTFYGVHKDGATNVLLNWADVRLLMISKTDLEGGVYSFTQFEEGDKAEIIATDGSSAVYGTVTNNPNNESYGNLIIEVERSSGGPFELKEFILSVYRPGACGGDVDLEVLDQRYATKQYVDEAIEAIDIPDEGVKATDRIIAKPSRWTYTPDVEAQNLEKGCFRFSSDKTRLYLARYNEFGNSWYPNKAEYVWNFPTHLICTIQDYGGAVKVMLKYESITFAAGGGKYARLSLKANETSMEPFSGSRYLINIQGLLPIWQFESFREYGSPTL